MAWFGVADLLLLVFFVLAGTGFGVEFVTLTGVFLDSGVHLGRWVLVCVVPGFRSLSVSVMVMGAMMVVTVSMWVWGLGSVPLAQAQA